MFIKAYTFPVEKVTDVVAIAQMSVMSTPGIFVDGKLVHVGAFENAGAIIHH